MPRFPPHAATEHQRELERLATAAPDLRSYRGGVLAVLRRVTDFDAALYHALSPRVPLDTAVIEGLQLAAVGRSMPSWDDLAVQLAPLRELANRRLVATDRDAFAHGSRARARYERHVVRPFGMRSLCLVHLVVRGSVHAAILLFSRRLRSFDPQVVTRLRELAPGIAVADTLHSLLDGVPRAQSPVHLACRDARLTPRQRQIVEHVALGHTNAEIARALEVSANTARNHLARIFARVGASNRADLVRLAVLTPPPS